MERQLPMHLSPRCFTSDAVERRRSLNALIRMLGKAAQEVT